MSDGNGERKQHETREERVARLEASIALATKQLGNTQRLIRQCQTALAKKPEFPCRYDAGRETACTYSGPPEHVHTLATSSAKLVEVVARGEDPLASLKTFCWNHRQKLSAAAKERRIALQLYRLEDTLCVVVAQGEKFLSSQGERKRALEQRLEQERTEVVRAAKESSGEDFLAELLGVDDLEEMVEDSSPRPVGEQTACTSPLIPEGVGNVLKERVSSSSKKGGNGRAKKHSVKKSAAKQATEEPAANVEEASQQPS